MESKEFSLVNCALTDCGGRNWLATESALKSTLTEQSVGVKNFSFRDHYTTNVFSSILMPPTGDVSLFEVFNDMVNPSLKSEEPKTDLIRGYVLSGLGVLWFIFPVVFVLSISVRFFVPSNRLSLATLSMLLVLLALTKLAHMKYGSKNHKNKT